MSELKIGYARVSTDAQDLTAQRDALQALGVEAERIYVDHGLTGTNRDRPGLVHGCRWRGGEDRHARTKGHGPPCRSCTGLAAGIFRP